MSVTVNGDDILSEIRDTRKSIHGAQDAVQEAQVELAQRKATLHKHQAALEELLCELEKPGSRFPLFEAANGHPNGRGAGKPPEEEDDPPEFAPVSEDDCLLAALELPDVRDLLAGLGKTADDDAIFRALIQWPTHRVIPGRGPGRPWAVVGGSAPRFFWGELAERTWPAGKATLEAVPLVARVRKLLRIGKPAKARKPAASK